MTENLYTPRCIRTYSGRYINVFEPNPDDILIEDIAHALSRQPRYGGHLPVEYSVARHSIACAEVAGNPEHALALLLHDATEAYMCDLAKPIKEEISQYKIIEDILAKAICEKFMVQYPFVPFVHVIDKALLEYEWNHVFLKKHSWWARLRFLWQHQFQKKKFLALYYKLRHTNEAQYL